MIALKPAAALALLVCAAPAAGVESGDDTPTVAVSFDVKKEGDVKWTGACTVDVYRAGEADADQTGLDAGKQVNLEPGKYDAVVACPSDEGTVKKSAAIVAKRGEISVPVSLDPGFLLVNVLRFDTPVRAEITVFDDRGHEVASATDKAVIPLCPGKVRVLAKVDDPGSTRPVFGNAEARIAAKNKSTVTVDTTDGTLTVFLSDNGRKAGGVAALRAPGQKTRLIELHAGEKGEAPPGTYDLVTQLDDTYDFSEVLTRNVVIRPKRATTKYVAHHTAVIRPRVLVDGHAPPADAQIDIELSTPGAPAPFNTAAVGDVLRVAAGTFVIGAVRKDARRDDGTPPKATATVRVHAGEQRAVTLDVTSARLETRTVLGGHAPGAASRSIEVEIDAPGNDVPVAKKTVDADGKASFSLSAGKVSVKAIFHAPQGDIVTAHDVSLALGSRLSMRLNLDVGTAVVQVFQGGVAVPAEVRFFKADKAQKPDKTGALPIPPGDALVSVPAGQDAYLPPGAYTLVVVRSGETHVFSDLKVASGRTVERTVEIPPS